MPKTDPRQEDPAFKAWQASRGGSPEKPGTVHTFNPGQPVYRSAVYETADNITFGEAWRRRQVGGTERAPDVIVGVRRGRKSKITIHEIPGPVRHKGDPNKDAQKGKIAQHPSAGIATTGSPIPPGVLPLNGKYDPDKRYQGKSPATHANLPPFPVGAVVLVLEATDEDKQSDLLVWADPRLCVANRGPSKQHSQYGTLVCEVDGIGAFDPERAARLQTAFRVLRRPQGALSLTSNRENSLSWTIGLTGKAEAVGGFVTDGGEPYAVHAAVNARMGGPFDVGYESDKFRVGYTLDQRPINALGFSTTTIFRAPPSWDRDGPLLFEFADWRRDAGSGTAPQECYIVWDPIAQYRFPRDGGPDAKVVKGMYRVITFSPIQEITPDEEYPPPVERTPSDPPPPDEGDGPTTPGGPGPGTGGGGTGGGPTTPSDGAPEPDPGRNSQGPGYGGDPQPDPGGGGRQGGGARPGGGTQATSASSDTTQHRAVAGVITELMLGTVTARPQPIGEGLRDWSHARRPSQTDLERYNARSPATIKATPFGAQAGPEFRYTQNPGQSRYPGGTASGGWFYTPPEIGPIDAASDFAPGGVTPSESALVYGPGVATVWGTIDPTTGEIDDGVRLIRNGDGKVSIEVLVGDVWTEVANVDADGLNIASGASVTALGGSAVLVKSGAAVTVEAGASVTLGEGVNVALGTASGTKIGTSATQKLGFFNAPPVVQPGAIAAPTGGAVIDDQSRTAINSIRAALAAVGITA